MGILDKNRNFGRKFEFWSKIWILVKNLNFGQKFKFWSKYWPKIDICWYFFDIFRSSKAANKKVQFSLEKNKIKVQPKNGDANFIWWLTPRLSTVGFSRCNDKLPVFVSDHYMSFPLCPPRMSKTGISKDAVLYRTDQL